MTILPVLPVVIPLTVAAVSLLAWRWRALQRWLGLAGTMALFGTVLWLFAVVWRDGVQVTQLGNWPAPFGITFVADLFSAIMLLLAGLMGVVVVLYSLASISPAHEAFGYYPLLQILLAGVCGAFLTGDIFNLYVWFEVMLIASFVLLALGGERPQLEGAVKYVTLNLISSTFFLTAVGILYGITGTLNLADLSRVLSSEPQPDLTLTVAMLFLVAFGIKAAVFPLFFWLPAAYHTPPVAVTALFSGLLTKVGVYASMRVFTLLFMPQGNSIRLLLLLIAGLTMVTGVLGAVAQNEFRRLLSFHIVSQIGYLLMGLGLFTPPALTGAIFFMAHVIVAKAALFLVSGITYRLTGTYELKKLGGLSHTYPGLALLFLLPAFSLAGIPPLSGFWAKLILIRAGLGAEHYVIVATALAVSILTLFSMTKIWTEVFWKEYPEQGPSPASSVPLWSVPVRLALFFPTAVLAACSVMMGLAVEPCLAVAQRAAEQLLHPAAYVQAVLGRLP
ncbi:MAG: Na+/H+ antiporter subunit D [Candidatus Binatia bacterium]|nr:Na+/H+ antiporter subunit D [Candidatus Binatia bacterium]